MIQFCYLQIRLLYCVHVGMNNFKQIVEKKKKMVNIFKYILGLGIEQQIKCVFRETRVYDILQAYGILIGP